MKIHIKNQTGNEIDFCCGENEYTLRPDEEVSIEVQDGDCFYFDKIR